MKAHNQLFAFVRFLFVRSFDHTFDGGEERYINKLFLFLFLFFVFLIIIISIHLRTKMLGLRGGWCGGEGGKLCGDSERQSNNTFFEGGGMHTYM